MKIGGNKKNILIVTPYWPTALKPGRGSFIVNQVEALEKDGYSVNIIVLERKSVRSFLSKDKDSLLSDREVTVYRYYSIFKFNFLDQLHCLDALQQTPAPHCVSSQHGNLVLGLLLEPSQMLPLMRVKPICHTSP